MESKKVFPIQRTYEKTDQTSRCSVNLFTYVNNKEISQKITVYDDKHDIVCIIEYTESATPTISFVNNEVSVSPNEIVGKKIYDDLKSRYSLNILDSFNDDLDSFNKNLNGILKTKNIIHDLNNYQITSLHLYLISLQ